MNYFKNKREDKAQQVIDSVLKAGKVTIEGKRLALFVQRQGRTQGYTLFLNQKEDYSIEITLMGH